MPDVASAIGFMYGNRNAGMHRLQLPDVVEGLSPDIARPGKADLTARAGQRCRAKSNRYRVTVRPKHDVARFDHDARIGFGSRCHRRVEIDFLAPRSSGRLMGRAAQIRSAVGVSSSLARMATAPARITIFRMPPQYR